MTKNIVPGYVETLDPFTVRLGGLDVEAQSAERGGYAEVGMRGMVDVSSGGRLWIGEYQSDGVPTELRVEMGALTEQVSDIIEIGNGTSQALSDFGVQYSLDQTAAAIELGDIRSTATQAKADALAASGLATDASQQAADAFNASVTATTVEYAVGTSATVAPATGWSTTSPARTPGSFVWMRTVITKGSGQTSITAPALLTGNTGAPGNPGAKGDDGTSVTITGNVATAADLPTGLTAADAGKGWITNNNGHLHVWSGTSWTDVGEIRGVGVTSITPFFLQSPDTAPPPAIPTGMDPNAATP